VYDFSVQWVISNTIYKAQSDLHVKQEEHQTDTNPTKIHLAHRITSRAEKCGQTSSPHCAVNARNVYTHSVITDPVENVSKLVRMALVKRANMAMKRSCVFRRNGNEPSVEVFLAILSCYFSCGESHRITQEMHIKATKCPFQLYPAATLNFQDVDMRGGWWAVCDHVSRTVSLRNISRPNGHNPDISITPQGTEEGNFVHGQLATCDSMEMH
jgi:hypothetical protein